MRIRQIEADITKMKVDVIVNAANNSMLGGGGVDGAIHSAAGNRLHEACMAFPLVGEDVRLPTGGVRITPAFNLPCKFVVHTAGPIWNRAVDVNKTGLLMLCYRRSLLLASLHGRSVAIPAISTGIFGYPIREACLIAVTECNTFSQEHHGELDEIFLVTFKSPEVTKCFTELGVANV